MSPNKQSVRRRKTKEAKLKKSKELILVLLLTILIGLIFLTIIFLIIWCLVNPVTQDVIGKLQLVFSEYDIEVCLLILSWIILLVYIAFKKECPEGACQLKTLFLIDSIPLQNLIRLFLIALFLCMVYSISKPITNVIKIALTSGVPIFLATMFLILLFMIVSIMILSCLRKIFRWISSDA